MKNNNGKSEKSKAHRRDLYLNFSRSAEPFYSKILTIFKNSQETFGELPLSYKYIITEVPGYFIQFLQGNGRYETWMRFISVANRGRTRALARFNVTTSCIEENEVLECTNTLTDLLTKQHGSIANENSIKTQCFFNSVRLSTYILGHKQKCSSPYTSAPPASKCSSNHPTTLIE